MNFSSSLEHPYFSLDAKETLNVREEKSLEPVLGIFLLKFRVVNLDLR
jgi:hypothetical protein